MSNDSGVADWVEGRIVEAEQLCAGLSHEQTASVQAWLVGALLSHFDPEIMGKVGSLSIPQPLSPARWQEYVRRAIAEGASA